jgi:type IV pilus assembly protein PilB
MQPPLKLKNAMISRIKIMASLDAERRLPQDGRIKVRSDTRRDGSARLDPPTLFGEKGHHAPSRQGHVQLDVNGSASTARDRAVPLRSASHAA